MPTPAMDPLVRKRSSTCQDMCHSCAHVPLPGEDFKHCMRELRCTRKAYQKHGDICCQWIARSEEPLASLLHYEDTPFVAPAPAVISMPHGDAEIKRHSDEIFARLRWCVDGGPRYWPANEHLHLAPGDDKNFVFGVPPWFADGSLNIAGIPDAHSSVIGLLPVGGTFISDVPYGWECKRCESWVDSQSREYSGPGEPEWWWWCQACRTLTSSNKVKTKKQKNEETLAAKCHKISFNPI